MSRLWLGTCALVVLLGGCIHTSKSDFVQHYSLGDSVPAASSQGKHAPERHHVLYIAPIAVPQWLEGTQMLYRLDYRHDARVSAYAHSDWIAPPATLLEPLLRHAIMQAHAWQAVTAAGDPVRASASLHIRLDDFSQDFAQPDSSSGVISATATLVDNEQGAILGQKVFHVQIAAPSADARGGVMALGQASHQFAAQLENWLQTVAASPSG